MSRQIRFYRSFEEAAEKEAKEIREQPPTERLRETVELIFRVYGVTREELILRPKVNKITFIARS